MSDYDEDEIDEEEGSGGQCISNFCDRYVPCTCVPGRTPVPHTLWRRLWYEGTYPNSIVKKVIGFGAGLLLTQFIFFMMLIVFRVPSTRGQVIIYILCTLLPIALALSPKVRVITMLVIPTMCTDKGQALIISYLLIKVLDGPMQQFTHNAQVFALSSVCGQDKLLAAKSEAEQTAKAPFIEIAEKVESIVEDVKKSMDKVEKKLDKVADSFDNVFDKLSAIGAWMNEARNLCNEEYKSKLNGTNLCKRLGFKVYTKCRRSIFALPCALNSNFIKNFVEECEAAGKGAKEAVCEFDLNLGIDVDFPDLGVDIDLNFANRNLSLPFAESRAKIKESVKEKKRRIKEFFAYDVTFAKYKSQKENRSTTYKEIGRKIKEELLQRIELLSTFLRATQFSLYLFSFLVVLMAMLYLRKFHKKIRFDNFYINQFLLDIDIKRKAEQPDKERIFPMTFKEKFTYIYPWSPKVTKAEVNRALLNLLKLIPLLINLLVISFCDIGLWYALDLVRGIFQADYDPGVQSSSLEMQVEGDGPIAKSYETVEPVEDVTTENDVDNWNCVPFPAEPDWEIYYTMRKFVIYLLLMVIFQGYILRMRAVICSLCYPKRARERAIFLYNDILQTRGGLLSFLKKQAKLRLLNHKNIEKVSICHRLAATNPMLRPILNALGYAQKYCIACGQAGPVKDMENFLHCRNYGCTAIFCKSCVKDLKNTCSGCNHPLDYSYIEVDEELDSSDDEVEAPTKKEEVNKRRGALSEIYSRTNSTVSVKEEKENNDDKSEASAKMRNAVSWVPSKTNFTVPVKEEKEDKKETPEQRELKKIQHQGNILRRALMELKHRKLEMNTEHSYGEQGAYYYDEQEADQYYADSQYAGPSSGGIKSLAQPRLSTPGRQLTEDDKGNEATKIIIAPSKAVNGNPEDPSNSPNTTLANNTTKNKVKKVLKKKLSE